MTKSSEPMGSEVRRYPGPKPFSQAEALVFNARASEVDRLYQSLLRNDQVMLYAKSGVGKSSLVNAGLIPKVLEKNWLVVPVRFFPFQPKDGYQKPIDAVFDALEAAIHPKDPQPAMQRLAKIADTAIARNTYLARFLKAEDSLWTKLKPMQTDGIEQILLVFDQLEELFTYPSEDISVFKEQLADLLYEAVPSTYLEALRTAEATNASILAQEELAHLYKKQPLKALGAIRDDAMHHLVLLVDYLPEMQQNLFELKALSREQASLAIVEPAKIDALEFTSGKFGFADDALKAILDFLTKGDEKRPADATLLQIICQDLEKKSESPKTKSIEGLPQITKSDLPDFGDLVKEFYLNIGKAAPGVTLLQVRQFVEGRLIANRKRVPVADTESINAIGADALNYLVREHLLRQEKNSVGDYSYELGHDTLVEPISELKEAREKEEREEKEAEERAAREKAEAEEKERVQQELDKERAARERERKQLRRARLFLGLAVGATLIALYLYIDSRYQRDKLAVSKLQADSAVTMFMKADSVRRAKEMESFLLKAQNDMNAGEYCLAWDFHDSAKARDSNNMQLRHFADSLQNQFPKDSCR